MKIELIKRKYNGEVYTYYLHQHNGENGILGVPQYNHISVETPENCFGYNDIVLLNHNSKKAYTMHRYLQPYILKQIEKKMIELFEKYDNR